MLENKDLIDVTPITFRSSSMLKDSGFATILLTKVACLSEIWPTKFQGEQTEISNHRIL